MIIQSSRAAREGTVTEAEWPRILSPWTEPAEGRLPSAMKTGNTDEIAIRIYGTYIYDYQHAVKVGVGTCMCREGFWCNINFVELLKLHLMKISCHWWLQLSYVFTDQLHSYYL